MIELIDGNESIDNSYAPRTLVQEGINYSNKCISISAKNKDIDSKQPPQPQEGNLEEQTYDIPKEAKGNKNYYIWIKCSNPPTNSSNYRTSLWIRSITLE